MGTEIGLAEWGGDGDDFHPWAGLCLEPTCFTNPSHY